MNDTYCILMVTRPKVIYKIPAIIEINDGMIYGTNASHISIVYDTNKQRSNFKTMLFNNTNESYFRDHMIGNMEWCVDVLTWADLVYAYIDFIKTFVYAQTGDSIWERTDLTQMVDVLKSIP